MSSAAKPPHSNPTLMPLAVTRTMIVAVAPTGLLIDTQIFIAGTSSETPLSLRREKLLRL